MATNRLHTILTIYTNLCRFVLAFVFIFSGFVKANDPWGFQYKLGDYLRAFDLPISFSDSFLFGIAVLLAIIEFTLGVYLLFGINRKLSSTLVLILMGFMTPLTLYLAIANPISDCGCFGDIWVISNWASFWKNVILLIAAITVFKWRTCMFRLITSRSEWLISLYTLVFITVVVIYCVQKLPIFDSRPYHIGANIREGMTIPEGETGDIYETRFILEKIGRAHV